VTSLVGKRILITGSTDGLGLASARWLASRGASLLVHGRNPSKLERALGSMPSGQAGPHGYLADLSSLEEARRLARDVVGEHERLDVLVNNAGVAVGERRTSRDGHELTFAVNYLSHFLLTLELLPLLRDSAPARVVNVASVGQQAIDFDDVMLERDYSLMRAYAQSKLAQIMFTIELAERLGPDSEVTVNALHPATLMDTNMVRRSFGRSLSTVAEGVEATVRLATAADVEGVTGRYFDGTSEAAADPQAYDADARRRLWELSEDLTSAGAGSFQS
jgi:NAD(P)-dependent dehydrogenase (short-subunit alcohol dehydrogenase family)